MSSEGQDPSASRSGQAAEADPMIGQVIDKRYRITSKLGEGGMGEVYAADHLRISRSVAIKLLRAEVLTNEEAVKRFEQEAMTASSIGHENIIRIEDSGKLEDGRIYLAMELLAGAPFNDLIDQPGPPVPPDRLLHILIQTCHGLAAAHEKGIVHRDMKPENIYITRNTDGSDLPKLLDFGIAKVSQAEGENHLTRTGTIFGTPFYMAPEQALGQAVDHRVDVYAMGVIMYEVFCGEVPFGGESFMGILTQHITSEPTAPSMTAQKNGRMLVAGVEEVIIRAMKKEPAQRYQSMDELCQALVPLYRCVAGSGMSTYMEAHAAPVSGGYRQHPGSPTPMPVIRNEHSQPYAIPQQGQHMGTAPPRTGNMGTGPLGHGLPTHAPPIHAPPTTDGFAHPHASTSTVFPKPKGKGGLIALLVLVLVAGGGAAAFFLVGGSDGGGDATAAATEDGDASAAIDAGSGVTTAATLSDAGASGVPSNQGGDPKTTADAGGGATTDPVKAEPVLVTVLLNSKPVGAKVYRDGKKIGKTPMNVKVSSAEPTSLVLKYKKHSDESVTLDGSEDLVTARLSRKGSSGKPDPVKPDPVKPDPIKPDPIKPDPIKPKDPCKRNPNLPECMLE